MSALRGRNPINLTNQTFELSSLARTYRLVAVRADTGQYRPVAVRAGTGPAPTAAKTKKVCTRAPFCGYLIDRQMIVWGRDCKKPRPHRAPTVHPNVPHTDTSTSSA